MMIQFQQLSTHDKSARQDLGALDLDYAPASLAYQDIVLLAANICAAPMALITVLDCNYQHILACIGLQRSQTRRENAFCAHALLEPDVVMVVEDARLDDRFKYNPHVQGGPFVRFYAGAPIVTKDGFPIGTVCVVDLEPRTLTASEIIALKALARAAACIMEDNQTLLDLDRPADLVTQIPRLS